MAKKMIIYVSHKALKAMGAIFFALFFFHFVQRIDVPTYEPGLYNKQLLSLVLIGVALGTDAFSLSVGIGMRRVCAYDILKTSIVIGIFHVIMPLIGIVLGNIFGEYLGVYAKYIGSVMIIFIGGNMIYESLKGKDEDCEQRLMGWGLIFLAISVSIDALTIGFGLGTYGFSVPLVVLIIGLFGGFMTAIGLTFGMYIGEWIGDKSEIAGGLVLISLGLKMFF